jgi:hypothetical protein
LSVNLPLLEHMSACGAALHHMVAALNSGGVLLIEKFHPVNWLPAVRADPTVRRPERAYRLKMEFRGAELSAPHC